MAVGHSAVAGVGATAGLFVAVRSGLWRDATTWQGGNVPGPGNTISIPDGLTVTLDDARTIGTSNPSDPPAVSLGNTGILAIAATGNLTCRGDIIFPSFFQSPVADAIQMVGGAVLEFDSSEAANPSTTKWKIGADGSAAADACRRIRITGAPGNYATIRSNTAGGNASITNVTAHGRLGLECVWSYAYLNNMGDASNPALVTGPHFEQFNVDIQNCIFDTCGSITTNNDLGQCVFKFNNNWVRKSLTPYAQNGISIACDSAKTTGRRELKNNAIDRRIISNLVGFTIDNNIVEHGGWQASLYSPGWGSFTNNLITWVDVQHEGVGPVGDMYDSYFFIDSDMGNPHMFQVRYQASSTIARCIMGQGGRNDQIGPLGGGTPDSGEFGFFGSYTEDGHMQTVTYCIFLPCALGYSTMELGTCNAGIPHMRDNVCDHNTWFGGWAPDAGGTTNGFGFLDFSEISNAPSNCWGSVRSNIMWNPGLAGYTSSFYKTRDMSHLQAGNPKPAVDIVTANRLDYNCGHGHTLSMASIAGVHDLTNEGNGYGGAFSVAPGAHDVDVNPDFVDWQRTMELWDSKYLGDSHAAWHPAHHYAEGDLVSHQRSDVYWSLPVNYRYIGNGANPEPGGGSNWRANWEWAALHQLRADTTSGRTYTDPTLGITDATAIQTMMAWVRKGYTPQNPHLKGAAHDGTDIGAMPMT